MARARRAFGSGRASQSRDWEQEVGVRERVWGVREGEGVPAVRVIFSLRVTLFIPFGQTQLM